MKKEKITLEYPLQYASAPILWIMIGSPLGLAEWFSDGVTVVGEEYTFTWDDYDQTAVLIERKENKCIRFQWEEDKGTDAYFELSIATQDLSGDVALMVTEFIDSDDPEELEDFKMLWDKHFESLRRRIGI